MFVSDRPIVGDSYKAIPESESLDRETTKALTNKTMLHHLLIHPRINEILGRAGHHAEVLIADGNYPSSSAIGPRADLVSLNLIPGVVSCTQVLEALLSAVPIEAASTMMYETTGPYAPNQDPLAWATYRNQYQV
ncbi:MAG: RbsD/FucU domain-containing protein [Candidatus Dormibacteraceae bacterium]